jgi:hypothetical protein|tara:strand:- start:1604 stop:1843 length:240 start_codon:yes stop_codon:yes gene_type:complete
MEYRVIKMLKKQFQADREKALLTLELLTENPAGIGDHSTDDFYKNAISAITALAEADDVLDTIERYYGETSSNWNQSTT